MNKISVKLSLDIIHSLVKMNHHVKHSHDAHPHECSKDKSVHLLLELVSFYKLGYGDFTWSTKTRVESSAIGFY